MKKYRKGREKDEQYDMAAPQQCFILPGTICLENSKRFFKL